MKDPSAFFEAYEAISPEAAMAQRLAELRDVAEFRQRHARAYKEWSKPENIDLRKAQAELEAPRALEAGKKISEAMKKRDEEFKKAVADGSVTVEKLKGITITPIYKPSLVKESWFSRMKKLFI